MYRMGCPCGKILTSCADFRLHGGRQECVKGRSWADERAQDELAASGSNAPRSSWVALIRSAQARDQSRWVSVTCFGARESSLSVRAFSGFYAMVGYHWLAK